MYLDKLPLRPNLGAIAVPYSLKNIFSGDQDCDLRKKRKLPNDKCRYDQLPFSF